MKSCKFVTGNLVRTKPYNDHKAVYRPAIRMLVVSSIDLVENDHLWHWRIKARMPKGGYVEGPEDSFELENTGCNEVRLNDTVTWIYRVLEKDPLNSKDAA